MSKKEKAIALLPRPECLPERRISDSSPAVAAAKGRENPRASAVNTFPPPPGQVWVPTRRPALPETSADAPPPSAYPGRPGSAPGGPPAAGVPAAASVAAGAHRGTRRPRGPSRPCSARLASLPDQAHAPRAGPRAPASRARLPLSPEAWPPAEPWGRFTHPGRCLALHRAGKPSPPRPGPHRASPATARAPEGGGAERRDWLARPAAPGAGSGEPRLHPRRGRARMEPRRARARVPTVPVAARRRDWGGEGGTGAARGPLPRAGSCRTRGRGCRERGWRPRGTLGSLPPAAAAASAPRSPSSSLLVPRWASGSSPGSGWGSRAASATAAPSGASLTKKARSLRIGREGEEARPARARSPARSHRALPAPARPAGLGTQEGTPPGVSRAAEVLKGSASLPSCPPSRGGKVGGRGRLAREGVMVNVPKLQESSSAWILEMLFVEGRVRFVLFVHYFSEGPGDTFMPVYP